MFRRLIAILAVAFLAIAGLVGGAAPASATGAGLYCAYTPEGGPARNLYVYIVLYDAYGNQYFASFEKTGDNGCANYTFPDAYRGYYSQAYAFGLNTDTGYYRYLQGASPVGAPGDQTEFFAIYTNGYYY